MKSLLAETISHFWPVFKEFPSILNKMMPIIKEIIETHQNNTDISDDVFVKWGNTLLHKWGPHLKLWIKALKQSPIKSFIKNVKRLEIDLDENKMDNIEEVLTWIEEMSEVMIELTDKEVSKYRGEWFKIFHFFTDSAHQIMEKKEFSHHHSDDEDIIKVKQDEVELSQTQGNININQKS